MEDRETGSSGAPGWKRGFWCLIATQFQVAFSDNVLKAVVTFIGLALATSKGVRDSIVPLLGILFASPFILFSMAGGWLADRFSKRSVTIGVKLFEIAVMGYVLAALWIGSLPMAMAGVFLMGVHSAFFGPSKYGLLPELLPAERLSWGNGILELGTFLAIIAGGSAGALMYKAFEGREALSAAVLIVLAAAGLACSLGISRVPAADPRKALRVNFLGDLVSQYRMIRKDRVLWLAVLGNMYFSFLGLLVLQNAILLGTDTLRVGAVRTSWLQAAMAIGVGLGSVAAGYLSGGKIEHGLIPLGALGLTVFGVALGRESLSYTAALVNLALLGFFGGFFYVPLAAIMQHRPERGHKGAVLAAANLLSFVGVLLAAAVYWLATSVGHLSPPRIFLLTAAMMLAGTACALWLLPDALVRLVLFLLTHTVYRIRVVGRENVPQRGGALFVSNHLSFVDVLLLIGSTDRFIRFMMYKDYYELPLVNPIARILRVIPISSRQRPRELVQSLREASEAIGAGEIVCIFAEGQITRIGGMLPFRRGFERIMKGLDAPIVPVNLDGVWGSIFSYQRRRFFWKLPLRLPYPVTVSFGRPLPAETPPHEVRRAVQELGSDAWRWRKARMQTLHRSFVRTARRHPMRFAMADASVPKLRFGAALARTIYLARRLRGAWSGQSMVGVLLPPSVPGALVNLAALLSGKVPVNLNYTVSSETLASCVRQCGITTIVTSKAFLERMPMALPCPAVMIEEAAADPRAAERLIALLMRWLLPAGLLERAHAERDRRDRPDRPAEPPPPSVGSDRLPVGEGPDRPPAGAPPRRRPGRVGLDDLATVIFSSGSTGDPKGVMLTHFNIAANVEQIGQSFALESRDRLLGILPFFHSFGFTGTLVLPMTLGLGVVYHPSPLDARAIGALAGRYAVTFLVATPTFLQVYVRGCAPEDFGSLQLVLAGAEKLSERVAAAFEERFGIRPMEGYGSTECSPAITVNARDFRAAGFRQVGSKRGRIGHPLPGISVRIVDPDTMRPVAAVGESGLLLVRGPNVMKGYLGRPDKTAEVLKDGWYVTGDIASEDEDGFLQITDRLSRFSKIGGEMVPHIRVEEALHELAGVSAQTFAVAGVPDDRKGERLVVLHTLPEEELKACLASLSRASLPNLWMPRPDAFYRVEKLPYLGTGKLDLRRVRELALELSAAGRRG